MRLNKTGEEALADWVERRFQKCGICFIFMAIRGSRIPVIHDIGRKEFSKRRPFGAYLLPFDVDRARRDVDVP